jgi:hypothetical protein
METDKTKQANTDQGRGTKATEAAHTRAEKDMAKDPEFNSHRKNDDLDEGELARLGGDKNDLA